MGRLFLEYLDSPRVYTCKQCSTPLADTKELVSKSFHSKCGRAYLFNSVVNVTNGPREDRLMTTGLHTVSDIHCNGCLALVGWKYVQAFEKSQQYKEGKFILERCKLLDVVESPCSSSPDSPVLQALVFDSDSEDTCV